MGGGQAKRRHVAGVYRLQHATPVAVFCKESRSVAPWVVQKSKMGGGGSSRALLTVTLGYTVNDSIRAVLNTLCRSESGGGATLRELIRNAIELW